MRGKRILYPRYTYGRRWGIQADMQTQCRDSYDLQGLALDLKEDWSQDQFDFARSRPAALCKLFILAFGLFLTLESGMSFGQKKHVKSFEITGQGGF